MLAHAYRDALHSGSCHWCRMIRIVEDHVITGYEHTDDCELRRIVMPDIYYAGFTEEDFALLESVRGKH